ncbi:hypothetical protein DER45DRAFT_594702 [Fusarium avenaceum]|nr:hypothetical protein DER45DRAFT_594702 [Fusarium avenaceum]
MSIVEPGSSTAIIGSCITSSRDSDSENSFSFSTAVCPSGWNYNAIARATHSSTVVTTAFCCASGYQFSSLHQDPQIASSVASNQCERWAKSAEDDGIATATASQGDGTLMVHQAWAITWDASDRATLSPKPPSLSSGQTIQTWEASQAVTSQALFARENEGHYSPLQDPWISFLMIGLPIILVCFFTCLYCMCFWNRRKMRKRGQEIQLDSMPARAAPGNPSANFK